MLRTHRRRRLGYQGTSNADKGTSAAGKGTSNAGKGTSNAGPRRVLVMCRPPSSWWRRKCSTPSTASRRSHGPRLPSACESCRWGYSSVGLAHCRARGMGAVVAGSAEPMQAGMDPSGNGPEWTQVGMGRRTLLGMLAGRRRTLCIFRQFTLISQPQ